MTTSEKASAISGRGRTYPMTRNLLSKKLGITPPTLRARINGSWPDGTPSPWRDIEIDKIDELFNALQTVKALIGA